MTESSPEEDLLHNSLDGRFLSRANAHCDHKREAKSKVTYISMHFGTKNWRLFEWAVFIFISVQVYQCKSCMIKLDHQLSQSMATYNIQLSSAKGTITTVSFLEVCSI